MSVLSRVWRGRILVPVGECVNLIETFWMIISLVRKLKHVSFDALLRSTQGICQEMVEACTDLVKKDVIIAG